MFNNVALDVFIGLTFIFLLYSLLATIVQEIIARRLSLRTRNLQKAIRGMLEDRPDSHTRIIVLDNIKNYIRHIVQSIARTIKPFPKDNLFKAFYDHPSIKYLGENSWRSKPSYISPAVFSQTMVQMLRGASYDGTTAQMANIEQTLFAAKSFVAHDGKTIGIDPETLGYLQQMFIDARKDIDGFKLQLENWFNETMDRTAGWYKRQTQLILFLLGFSVALIFNVDTIAIYRILSKDKGSRDRLVELAVKSTPAYDTVAKEVTRVAQIDTLHEKNVRTLTVGGQLKTDTVDTLKIVKTYTILASDARLDTAYHMVMNDISNANSILGLGWPDKDSCKVCDSLKTALTKLQPGDSLAAKATKAKIAAYEKDYFCTRSPYQRGGWESFWGWVITALAISLGAPFWFDLLSKVVSLRSTGPRPDPAATSAGTSPGSGGVGNGNNTP